MPDKQLNDTTLEEILHVIKSQYGYDFNDYAHASIMRRVQRCMEMSKTKNVFDLKFRLTNEPDFFNWFLESVTVNVTEMFRDPEFYKDIRTKVIPKLASYPFIKIWHAGCATGEEVYSMAILLKEEGLLERTRIYATDLNPANLEKARKGIIPMSYMKNYTQNYLLSGGKSDFSEYYTARYGNSLIRKDLLTNILFSQHNLVTDQVFNEFQLVICRNVLIYFNKKLQDRVLRLFYDSMSPLGYLSLGIKESLLFSPLRDNFQTISANNKIFRRKS
ncbi:MAG: protein-glutamate O-methyltransferase CheR [Sphingobacteriales bacterium]|nr:MAG: protein-glutamate O-methyltransferase CheR [Sphingobacteriales bacterium]